MTVPSTDDKVPRLSRWHEAPLGVCHAAMRFAITVVNSKHVCIWSMPRKRPFICFWARDFDKGDTLLIMLA